MQSVQPLAARYWRETPQNRALRAALLVTAGVCLLAASAQFKVPYYPVPMTLQTLVVLLLAMGYDRPLAIGSVIAYLALGAAGAPVFAGGGGIAYFTGPTGGFLIGFAVATVFAAHCVQRGAARRFGGALAVAVIADLLIFVCGVGQLALIVGDFQKALALGAAPFIIGDLSKAALAAALVSMLAARAGGDKQRGGE